MCSSDLRLNQIIPRVWIRVNGVKAVQLEAEQVQETKADEVALRL